MKRLRYIPLNRPHAQYLEVAVNALQHVRHRVHQLLEDRSGLEQASFTAPDGHQKVMLQVDKAAENECARFLRLYFGDDEIRVLGEETLWKFKDLDLRKHHLEEYGDRVHLVEGPETRITVITDMIDGSDLVERNFGNWCSAMIFFRPGPCPGILFSLIHHEDGTIYGADDAGSFVIPAGGRKGGPLLSLRGPEPRKLNESIADHKPREETAQIAICYYGQNFGHFSTLPSELSAWARKSGSRSRLRFYNFGGNPMMARLANGENVHAVFEHIGQFPHDAAPGAFIGLKAGAHLVSLSETIITADDLAQSLMTPSGAGLQYVLASTKQIAFELARVLGSGRMFYVCPENCGTPGSISLRSSDPPVCNTCHKTMISHDRRTQALAAAL
jgi:hypothetical protein